MTMKWQTLDALRPGAVFVTEGGILAMKTEYHTFDGGTQWNCYLLESGESAHFANRDTELVCEIEIGPAPRGISVNPAPPETRALAIDNHRLWKALDMIQSEARHALRLRDGE